MDALSALGAAAEGYDPAALQPYVSTIWQALRGELLAPAGAGLLPNDLAQSQQVDQSETVAAFRMLITCSI